MTQTDLLIFLPLFYFAVGSGYGTTKALQLFPSATLKEPLWVKIFVLFICCVFVFFWPLAIAWSVGAKIADLLERNR